MLLLFWQISALDLESINVKFYFKISMCLTSFLSLLRRAFSRIILIINQQMHLHKITH